MPTREGPEPFADYPNGRLLLVDMLEVFGKTGTDTPTTWKGNVPFIQVTQIGGSDDGWTDRQRIDVYVFVANGPGAARQGQLLAEKVRQFLTRSPHYVGRDTIDDVRVYTSPYEISSVNESVRRWFASYEVHVSRTARTS